MTRERCAVCRHGCVAQWLLLANGFAPRASLLVAWPQVQPPPTANLGNSRQRSAPEAERRASAHGPAVERRRFFDQALHGTTELQPTNAWPTLQLEQPCVYEQRTFTAPHSQGATGGCTATTSRTVAIAMARRRTPLAFHVARQFHVSAHTQDGRAERRTG